MAATEDTDGRRRRGQRTRESILEAAANIASVDGLEGLTIGRLAGELHMSKSGLFAHFGSKEELQLATIATARDVFHRHVIAPSQDAVPGLPQLRALIAAWLAYLGDGVFPGGCFFCGARAEFDARAPGPVRDALEHDFADWQRLVERSLRAAQRAGQLAADVDVEQLSFELDALGAAANLRFQLQGDHAAVGRAEAAIEARLRTASS
jgi:AcrR family transcriptional regulator